MRFGAFGPQHPSSAAVAAGGGVREDGRVQPVPAAALPRRAGVGLKSAHYDDVQAGGHGLGFFEVHAENYMGAGGPPHRFLERIRERWPLSIHGVGLSLGGTARPDADHLGRLSVLCDRYAPATFSEHLAWSTHGGAFLNDLLPLPYNRETLELVCAHVDEVQEALGRPLLLENPSTYLDFAETEMEETDFLAAVAERTGCGLLLDVNNIYVSATNHGFDAGACLDRFPVAHVREIHLAGHAVDESPGPRLLIDSHGTYVAPEVWGLYERALERAGPVPTLIEWDNDVPDFAVLVGEAAHAERYLAAARRKQAA